MSGWGESPMLLGAIKRGATVPEGLGGWNGWRT
jgi:hypothetical protein